MLRSSARVACGLSLALLIVSSRAGAAEEAVLAEFYGSGVHQYFSGNAAQAIADLTTAIKGGTKDPRAYYFRALAQMRQGNQAGAQADLQKGAALESSDLNQFYPVGKSLERVQGASRLAIERYRTVARAEALARQQRRDATRYEDRRRAEARVLRAMPEKPAMAIEPVPKEAATPDEPSTPADDPFAEQPAAEEPAAGAPPTPEPPADMPAEDADAVPEAKPEGDDPFGEPEAMPDGDEMKEEAATDAEPAAEEKPADPATGDADPFGDEKPADEKPAEVKEEK